MRADLDLQQVLDAQRSRRQQPDDESVAVVAGG
jgi:hypothetical protein